MLPAPGARNAEAFRDAIKTAVGVDVVQIAKSAANIVIGSFVAAYEDIKFVWTNFPDIVGAAAPGIIEGSTQATQAESRNRPGFFR